MEKIKLHKWSVFLSVPLLLAVGCSKRSFPADNSQDEKYETAAAYVPPAVITIADDKAKTNRDGELYYDDEYGYRYWRYCDGRYYLDRKYEGGKSVQKKNTNRKKTQKSSSNSTPDGYATNR